MLFQVIYSLQVIVGVCSILLGLLLAPSLSFAADSTTSLRTLGSTSSLQTVLANTPDEAKHVAPLLAQTIQAFESAQQASHRSELLRTEQDGIQTELVAMHSELELLTEHRKKLTQQLSTLEQNRHERLESLRGELESRLQAELSQTRQQLLPQHEKEFARQISLFEVKERELIDKSVDIELETSRLELEQLGREIDAQTKELVGKLARLRPDSEAAASLEQSMRRTLVQLEAELKARQQHLESQRTALLAKRKQEFIETIRRQQQADMQRRLMVKEASLRQAMAELFHKTNTQEVSREENVRNALAEASSRFTQLTQRQALLKGRNEAVTGELDAASKQFEAMEQQQRTSIASLEQAFQKPNPGLRLEALSWFGKAIQFVPNELANELEVIRQRLTVKAEQERRVREERRLARERQLAWQVSQEMERQYSQAQQQRQRDQEARQQKSNQLLAEAKQFESQGRYDQALRLINQAQTVNPAQAGQMALMKEQMLAVQQQAQQQAQTAVVEQKFNQAMQAFNQGSYEDAITLFEQVIAQEATQPSSGATP